MSEHPLHREVCAGCGRSRVELNGCRDGSLLCLRCYLARFPEPHLPPQPPLLRRKKPPDPGWVAFRKRIIAALARDGEFLHLDEDRCGGRCPICGDPLHVRFIGRRAAADFTCLRGCAEREVVAMLGKARSR